MISSFSCGHFLVINTQSKEFPSTEEVTEKTKSDVPAWKKEILNKKIQRYNNGKCYMYFLEYFDRSDRGEEIAQKKLPTAEEQRKAKFNSLPEWKKKLILQKQSKLT